MTDFEKTYQNYNPRQAALDEARALLTAAAKAAAQGTPYSKSEVYKQMLALQAGETEE